MDRVSIIIPVIRPDGARRCIKAIKKHAGVSINQYEIVDRIDSLGVGCPQMVRQLTDIAENDLVMFLGDDTIPQPGFLKAALDEMAKLPDGWGVVGLNTTGKNPVAHWLAHKKMLPLLGGEFFNTDYRHCWCDNELMDIAIEHGRWAWAEGSEVEHDHPIFKGNKIEDYDEGYTRAYSSETKEHDQKTYWRRKRARMQDQYGTKLAIAEPLTDDKVYSHYHFSSIRLFINYLIGQFHNGGKINFDFLTPNYPGQVDAIRNNLVRQALFLGCTHILMIDTDQIYKDEDMISRMLSHKLPVVGAKVHRRYPPFDPLVMRGEFGKMYNVPDEEIESGELIKVDATGCGCILYDTNIFIEMDQPWFEFKTKEGHVVGEDVGFCHKLTDRGIDIYVDCSIDIQHLTLLAADWGTHKLFKKITGGQHGFGKQEGH